MQISKISLVATAALAAICIVSSARAADSAVQVKAREAVRQKMLELGDSPAPAPLPEAPKKATAAPAPTTVVAPVTPAAPAANAAQPQKTQETDKAGSFEEVNTAAAADPASVEKARTAVEQRMSRLPADPADLDASAAQMRKSPSSFPVLEPPPSPLTSSQQERLAELLKVYRADAISPEEYHRQRAKILSEK